MVKKLLSFLLGLMLCFSLALHTSAAVPSSRYTQTPLTVYSNSDYLYAADLEMTSQNDQPINWLLCVAVGGASAAIVLFILCSAMNTKRMQHGASGYVKTGTFQLRQRQDLFLYSNISKVRRQQNNSNGRHNGR